MTRETYSCALYARRSKEEHQTASIDVQLEEARRYIAAKGWSLAPEHVFVDNSVSRAEFKKRPGLIALLNAAEARAFDVVVVRDETRLGGDTTRTSLLIQDLLDAGVKLYYYFNDEEVIIDGAVSKFMVAVRNFAGEIEREKIAQRTHEHLLTKARRGLNVGGRVYGYDNVEMKDGDRRVRVEYAINPEQAEIVREIFARCGRGEGLRTIVKDLNARHVPSPRAGKRGTGSWSTAAASQMLRRERSRGVIVWNTREKTYRNGTKVRIPRAEHEWIRVDAPHLRIITDDVWLAVQARMRANGPKAKRGRPTSYLLSGIARCGQCGGPLTVSNGRDSNKPIKVYSCAYHRERGDTVCTNTLRRPVEAVNQFVADWIKANVLTEEVMLRVVQDVRRRLSERVDVTSAEGHLEREATKLRAEIERLVDVLASSTQKHDAIMQGIADRQERLSALDARMRATTAAPQAIQLEFGRAAAEAQKRINDLRTTLERNPEEAKQVMRAIFDKPLRVTPVDLPEGRRFQIEAMPEAA